MNKQKGFSLIELLIVVAIILIIAAIAIPNLLRAKMAANESSAVGSLHTINTAEAAYTSNYPTLGYSADLPTLGGASPCATAITTAACLIDDTLANATTVGTSKSGYYYTYLQVVSGGVGTAYSNTATPANQGVSGQRNFFTNQGNVIRYGSTGPADVTSSPIQ
jgi:prepilin-type N-terminal cleavage/methylation domain-containing protein